VSDATYARALEAFGEQGVIDLIGVSGYYSMLAMMMNVARTPPPAGMAEPLKHFPD
jgi:4-carboxymuconolactone decarboxylase